MRRVVGQYPVKKVFPHWYEWRETGVRGIPSPFIKIYERGRDTPHPSLWSSTAAAEGLICRTARPPNRCVTDASGGGRGPSSCAAACDRCASEAANTRA